jgi:hypothetical protein
MPEIAQLLLTHLPLEKQQPPMQAALVNGETAGQYAALVAVALGEHISVEEGQTPLDAAVDVEGAGEGDGEGDGTGTGSGDGDGEGDGSGEGRGAAGDGE